MRTDICLRDEFQTSVFGLYSGCIDSRSLSYHVYGTARRGMEANYLIVISANNMKTIKICWDGAGASG